MSFADDLWDGFEIVARYLQDGFRDAKDIENFLRNFIDLQTSQAKQLRNLLKEDSGPSFPFSKKKKNKAKAIAGEGTLYNAWEETQQQIEALAIVHESSGEKVAENILKEFSEELALKEAEMKKYIDLGEKQVKALQNAHAAHEKNKAHYWEAKENENKQLEALEKAKESNDPKLPKVEEKLEKASQETTKFEGEYKSAVEFLNTSQTQFYEDLMPSVLQGLEALEKDRGELVCAALQNLAQTLSDSPNEMSNAITAMKNATTAVDIETDLQEFIQKNASGERENTTVEFEEYEEGKVVAAPKSKGGFFSRFGKK